MHLADNMWLTAEYRQRMHLSASHGGQSLYKSHLYAIADLEPFDTFIFGSCPVSTSSKPAEHSLTVPLTWLVLKKEGTGKLLAVTRDCIDWEFFSGEGKTDWHDSRARELLNQELFPKLFSPHEAMMVQPAEIEQNGTKTEDKLFLLSCEEVLELFPSSDALMAALPVLEEDFQNPGRFSVINDLKPWWLRTPGKEDDCCMAVVTEFGELDEFGIDCDADEIGIRPAMRLDLSAFKL